MARLTRLHFKSDSESGRILHGVLTFHSCKSEPIYWADRLDVSDLPVDEPGKAKVGIGLLTYRCLSQAEVWGALGLLMRPGWISGRLGRGSMRP